jgi:hypothetical protein
MTASRARINCIGSERENGRIAPADLAAPFGFFDAPFAPFLRCFISRR